MTQDTSINAIPRHDKSADRLRKTIKITGPASYVTGGDPISLLNDLGLSNVHMICGNVMRTTVGGAECRLVALNREDPAAPTLQWYDMAGNEIAGAVDLSTFSGEIEFIGQ